MHRDAPDWGTSGPHFYRVVQSLIAEIKPTSAIDYGCGKGALAAELHAYHKNLPIMLYDPGIPQYSAPPPFPADVLICTDVLEHVEDDRIDDVLRHMAGLTRKAAFIVIHTGPAKHVLPDGRNAHILQRPREWWEVHMNLAFEHFEMAYIDTGLPNRFEVIARRKGVVARMRDKLARAGLVDPVNEQAPIPARVGLGANLGNIGK